MEEEGRIIQRTIYRKDPAIRKRVAIECGYQCAFPACHVALSVNGTFIGEVASIVPVSEMIPGNPEQANSEDYLLVCPTHHRVIAHERGMYTTQWLRDARAKHLDRLHESLAAASPPEAFKLPATLEVSLTQALEIWKTSKGNPSEEFWQQLFQKCPAAIAQIFPTSMIKFGEKCYVGGKFFDNSGGNLIDFIYASKSTNNVVLVEIKSPTTKLLGKKYRANAYCLSDELSGSIVQVLNYKDSLIKQYHGLSQNKESAFTALSPRCVVIVGSTVELDCSEKMNSFELFRNEIRVEIVTYDELFEKIQCVLDIAR